MIPVTHLYMYMMSLIMFVFVIKFDKQLLRPRYKSMAYWILFLLVNMVLKYYLFSYTDHIDLAPVIHFTWVDMILAGFEEVTFTLPIYYISRYKKHPFTASILMTMFAVIFASGHAYQGIGAVAVTFVYMRFVAPRFMGRYGLTNMIIGHSLYDLSVLAIIKML